MFLTCLYFLGVVALASFLLNLVKLVLQVTREPKKLSDFGEWALVTGATDGIGKEIAFELANKGQNLIIVGRNPEKLETTRNEISAKYANIDIDCLEIDLSNFDDTAKNKVINSIKSKNVGILINNAGLSYPFVTYFDEVEEKVIDNMMNVNNRSAVLLTHLLLKESFLKKNKGAVVNISSAGSIVPHELHSLYSASKSFLNKFTLDLALEYTRKNIEFQVQLPYFVCSKMSRVRKPSLTIPTAKDFAKASVRHIGYSGICFPFTAHALIFFLISYIPEIILVKVIRSMHHKIMKKAKKKYDIKPN